MNDLHQLFSTKNRETYPVDDGCSDVASVSRRRSNHLDRIPSDTVTGCIALYIKTSEQEELYHLEKREVGEGGCNAVH